MHRRLLISACLAAAGLAGCSSAPPTAPSPASSASPARSLAASKQALLSEQHRLADLFRGTPVVFAMQPDASLRVEVPLRYAFDPGQSIVKPPLAAVLERLARSQRDEPTRWNLTAPTDPGAKALQLATERAVRMRDAIVTQGLDAARFTISAAARGGIVIRIAVSDPAAAP